MVLSSYATLPRNRHHRGGSGGGSGTTNLSMTTTGSGGGSCQQSPQQMDVASSTGCTSFINKNSRLQNVINYQNLETTTHLNESGSIGLCTGCLKNQDDQYGGGSSALNGCTISLPTATSTSLACELNKAASATAAKTKHHPRCCIASTFRPTKYDNMGRRITASGNSTLSIPDEEKELNYVSTFDDRRPIGGVDGGTGVNGPTAVNNAIATVGLPSCSSSVSSSSSASHNIKSNSKLSDGGGGIANGNARTTGDDKTRSELHGTLLLPTGCDYVSL